MFLNLSNHPSDTWSPEQRAAAKALGGPIRDVSFPAVPPEYDTADVEAMATKLEEDLPPGLRVAMVAGEPTLCALLVRRLQRRGVRCVAATTRREVEVLADGREARHFRFVRFRDWPRVW